MFMMQNKSLGQSGVRGSISGSNLSGSGQTNLVKFTAQTHIYQQRFRTQANNIKIQNFESSQVFYHP
jgi:hypothetical protein